MTDIETLKKKKKEKKITFDELSKISGIPVNTIYDIFRGITKNPRIDTMQAIERALDINEPIKNYTQPSNYLTEDEKRLLNAYRNLIPTMKEHLLSLAESLPAADNAKEKNNLA